MTVLHRSRQKTRNVARNTVVRLPTLSAGHNVAGSQPASYDSESRAILVLARLRFVCFALFMFCTPTVHSADTVRATIEKETAWTGEAVPLVVTLYSPGPFSGTASFELPELPRTAIVTIGNPVVGSEVVDGDTWLTQRHEFRLYTQQTGLVVVPKFEVRFKGKKTFTSDPEPMRGTTHQLRFQSNRPPGTEKLGVIVATTQMEFEQSWTPNDIETVKAGDVIQRTITRSAAGTTAMMMPPTPTTALDGVRVYTSNPIVEDKTERGKLSALRSDILKYQFERAGKYELPEKSFAWWNTQAGELRRETLPGKTIHVEGVAPIAKASETNASEAGKSPWPVVFCVMGIGLFTWICFKPVLKLIDVWQAERNRPDAVLARRVEAACRSDNASAAYAALLDWRRTVLSQGQRSADRLKQAASQTELFSEWDKLSAFLFGPQPGNREWAGRRLNAAFTITHEELKRKQHYQSDESRLPALNTSEPLSQ